MKPFMTSFTTSQKATHQVGVVYAVAQVRSLASVLGWWQRMPINRQSSNQKAPNRALRKDPLIISTTMHKMGEKIEDITTSRQKTVLQTIIAPVPI